MDSIPQELIDEIIENVPKSSLLSCSLVAKRWQRESQRRAFDSISFLSEDDVNQWCTDISQDLDGISSYVRHAHFKWIYSWNEPALFSRILGNLSSLTALSVYRTEIPDEFPDHISRGEFGKGITALYLHSPHCTLATMTSMILSLPDLKELSVKVYWVELEEPLPTHSITPRRGPLDSLELSGDADGIGENLAKSRFISSRLFLEVHIPDAVQLLTLSSETVVELKLRDISTRGIPPPIHLLSFPALTTLVVYLHRINPSPRLTNVLCSIGSAPALTSITIKNHDWELTEPWADPWVDVDRWLSQIARHAKTKGGFPLTLRGWKKDESLWQGFLPEFRESGGKIELTYW